jgi:ribonucleoside-diphosphate reductase alpha chain
MNMANKHKKHKLRFNELDLDKAKAAAFESGFEQGTLTGRGEAGIYLAAERNKLVADFELAKAALVAEVADLKSKIGQPVRRRLPTTRKAVTHRFQLGGHEGYMTVGMFEDGTPGELFVSMSKEGSTIGGLMDTVGTLTSVALQYGVSLETLVAKFSHQRFEPSGWSTNKDIGLATSIIDYVFRWMSLHFAVKPVSSSLTHD